MDRVTRGGPAAFATSCTACGCGSTDALPAPAANRLLPSRGIVAQLDFSLAMVPAGANLNELQPSMTTTYGTAAPFPQVADDCRRLQEAGSGTALARAPRNAWCLHMLSHRMYSAHEHKSKTQANQEPHKQKGQHATSGHGLAPAAQGLETGCVRLTAHVPGGAFRPAARAG
jgi:hypothetical protein